MTSLLWWSLGSKREPGKGWREDELLETVIRALLSLLELPASSPSPLPPPLFLHPTSSPSLLSLPSLLLLLGFAAETTPAAEWGKTSVFFDSTSACQGPTPYAYRIYSLISCTRHRLTRQARCLPARCFYSNGERWSTWLIGRPWV